MRILNCCVVYQVSKCLSWVSAIPAAYLLCSTAVRRDIRAAWCFCSFELPYRRVECVLLHCFNAQPYIFAVVDRADAALSVFYSHVLTRYRYFCSYERLCLCVECYVLLQSPNLER